jgi:hypothetical protein
VTPCSRTTTERATNNLWRGSLSDRRTVPLDCVAGPAFQVKTWGPLRAPAGASSLATERVFACRSEPARDGLKSAAFSQDTRVIVDDHRRNAARSKLAPTGLVGVRSICELPNLLWERACPRKR